MKAILHTGREEIEVRDVERPVPDDGEVLVRVESVGVCGSDVHAYKQVDGFDWITIPRIMGHEYSGTVDAVGANVSRFDVGDTVVERPIHPCGDCYQCQIGEYNVCQNTTITGMHTDGACAEYITVDEDHLVFIPEGVSTTHAAITEPLSIATRALYDRSSVVPGDTVVVQGPGPIGVLVAALADSLGANVVVSGLGTDAEHRLPLLNDLGIDTVDIQEEDLDAYVDDATDGVGVEAVFDTTGHRSGIEMAVDYVRKGGEIVEVGLPGEPSELFFTPIVRGELDIKASYGSTNANFEQAVRVIQSGAIDLDTIIDTRYSTDDPDAAFDDFLNANTCKPMFSF